MTDTKAGQNSGVEIPEKVGDASSIEGYGLTSQQYFIWDSVNGERSLDDICRYSGLGYQETATILTELKELGAVRFPHAENPVQDSGSVAKSTQSEGIASSGVDSNDRSDLMSNWGVPFSVFPFDEALVENSVLSEHKAKRVLYFHHYIHKISYLDLFGVGPEVSVVELRRRYYKLSREFHPDNWYGEDLGSLNEQINAVFKWVNKGFKTLSSGKRRKEYLSLLAKGYLGPWELPDDKTPPASSAGEVKEDVKSSSVNRMGLASLMAQAKKASKEKRLEVAIDCYRRALKLSDSINILIMLAHALHLKEKNSNEALEIIEKVMLVSPDNGPAMLLKSRLLMAHGRLSEARALCDRIIGESPGLEGLAEHVESLGKLIK